MNGVAVAIGLFYGCFSAALCYALSMLTSGLFARPSYRLYARVLIGICSIMLAAPGLRWLASVYPLWGMAGLRVAQYLAVGVLLIGVVSFNRKILPRIFARQATTVYFMLGTWANAALVSLLFLQFAVSGSTSWEALHGESTFLTLGHYGPLLMMVAAMVFHTDYRLKVCKRQPIHFTRFTFIGYAIAFLAIGVSMLPFAGKAFADLGLSFQQWSVLQSSSSAQTLLIAILLFAWLVWHYETIPPLFALLAVIIGEYHVLVTQWSIQWFGPESWALACLPLVVGISWLDGYFSRWESRKEKYRGRLTSRGGLVSQSATLAKGASELRFALPFRLAFLAIGLAILLLPLWFRFATYKPGAWWWLGVTFVVYAEYCCWHAWSRQQPKWLYAGGTLALLAAILGFSAPGQPVSNLTLSGLALAWTTLAIAADRLQWSHLWRTVTTDCAMVTALIAWGLVFSRHLWGDAPYYFQMVGPVDSAALIIGTFSLLVCAYLYRSCLPVYLALAVSATIAPTQSAVVGFLAIFVATAVGRLFAPESKYILEDRLRFLDRVSMPYPKRRTELFLHAFSKGVISLGLSGLGFGVMHVVRGDLTSGVVFGLVAAALTLGMATRTQQHRWLYITAILAGYLSMHVAAHSIAFGNATLTQAFSAHLCLAVAVSLLGFVVARVNAYWSQQLLLRVAEDKESAILERGQYYSGVLQQFTLSVSLGGLVLLAWAVMQVWPDTLDLMLLSGLLFLFFSLVAIAYRTQVATYLGLASLTLGMLLCERWLDLAWLTGPLLFAGLSLVATVVANMLSNPKVSGSERGTHLATWDATPPAFLTALSARGPLLWRTPLAIYAVACGIAAYAVVLLQIGDVQVEQLRSSATFSTSILLVGLSLLLSTRVLRLASLYVAGWALGLAWIHTLVDNRWLGNETSFSTAQIHLGVAACVAVLACVLATVWSAYFRWRIHTVGEQEAESMRAARSLFAGNLQHFAFAVLLIVSVLLLMGATLADTFTVAMARNQVATCSVLALGFGLLGTVYRSRIHSYFALASIAVGVFFGLDPWMTSIIDVWAPQVLFAVLGMMYGIFSYLACRSKPLLGPAAWDAKWPVPKSWGKPPLPGLALGWSLWAKPLADVSILMAAVAVFRIAVVQAPSDTWLLASVMVAVSLTFWLSTFTYRLGILQLLAGFEPDSSAPRQRWDLIERQYMFAFALAGFASSFHIVLHRQLLVGRPLTEVLSGHLLLAACLSLGSWALAVVAGYRIRVFGRCREQMSDELTRQLNAAAETYAGVPQRLSGLMACLLLAVAVSGFFAFESNHWALTLTPLVLTVVFGLLGATYQARLGSYLSQFSGVLFLVLLSRQYLFSAWTLYVWVPAVLAMCSLVLILLAQLLKRFSPPRETASPRTIPSFRAVPLPFQSADWGGLWMKPARDSSMVCLSAALSVGVASYLTSPATVDSAIFSVATYLLSIATLVIATGVFRAALPMYLACGLLAAMIFPASTLLGQPVTELSLTWAVLATVFWMISFMLERIMTGRQQGGCRQSSLLPLYEPPLIRSSVVLSTLSIVGSLVAFVLPTYSATPWAVCLTCVVGATTLLLSARSARMIHHTVMARWLVGLACLALAGGIGVASFAYGGVASIGVAWVSTAVVMSLVGAILVGLDRASPETTDEFVGWHRLFGEPVLVAAIAIASISVAIDGLLTIFGGWEAWEPVSPTRLAFTMLLCSSSFAIAARTFKRSEGLHLSVALGGIGLAIWLATPLGWSHPGTLSSWLLVTNTLVIGARLVHAYPARAKSWLGVDASLSEMAFYLWSMLGTTLMLIWQSVHLVEFFTSGSLNASSSLWLLPAGLTCCFYYQACYHSSFIYALPLLIVSTIAAAIQGGVGIGAHFVPVDLWLIVLGLAWGSLSLWLSRHADRAPAAKLPLLPPLAEPKRWLTLMRDWSLAIMVTAVVVSLPVSWKWSPTWPTTSVTVILACLGFAAGGWQKRNLFILTLAMVLFPIGLSHAVYFYAGLKFLTALAAPMVVIASTLYCSLSSRLGNEPEFAVALLKRIAFTSESLVLLAFLAGLHGITQVGPGWLSTLTMLLISGWWLQYAFHKNSERYIYATVAALATAVATFANGILGIALQPNPILAFSVIGTSFLFFAVNIVANQSSNTRTKVLVRPTYYLAIFTPILLLVSIPFNRLDTAALSMVACGAFYLLVSYQSHRNWGLYVAIVCFNVAVYIWMPFVQASTGLFQLYVHPAALSVLLFAHLHRRELKPQVLSSIRFAACSVILATSTLEVFASNQASLVLFVVVLALSLIGTAAGIALRVRAFVFIGVAFLILNVVGQVGLQFHREGGIIRAVILIGVGVLILAAMIFFNVHRERILSEYRRFISDPEWQ